MRGRGSVCMRVEGEVGCLHEGRRSGRDVHEGGGRGRVCMRVEGEAGCVHEGGGRGRVYTSGG